MPLPPRQRPPKAPKVPLTDFSSLETRFVVLTKSYPERAKELMKLAQEDVNVRWAMYEQLAKEETGGSPAPASN